MLTLLHRDSAVEFSHKFLYSFTSNMFLKLGRNYGHLLYPVGGRKVGKELVGCYKKELRR